MALIKKVHIANGIFWVEIPDAGLRICCGVPPDAVKFLKKKNYITSSSQNETDKGPNAILLSDAMIQNHMLCNLGEFPVMQMLYMQGMINDRDRKPLIMGLESVVRNQMEYIKRGNYGMLDADEIAAVHNDDSLSPKMIHSIKEYFAEGKFLDTNTLCESICLNQYEKHTIKKDVYIARIEFNVFKIEYQDESVIVDLNLAHNSNYQIPYHLENFTFKFNSFSVLHAGEGNGWHPDQPCMGSVLINNNKLYCIDCGPNLVNNLLKIGIDIQDLDGIFLTHIHDDHFAGLADLLKSTKKLKLYTSALIRNTVERKFAALLGLGINVFSDFFEFEDLELEKWNAVDDFEVKPVFSPHPVETNVFLFRKLKDDHYHTYSHLADTISFEEMELIRKSTGDNDQLGRIFDKVKSAYLEKANVKKVDVGGGKIHGVHQDYQNDESDKIVFSHIDHPYYNQGQTTIRKACFGSQDILIDDEETTHLQLILKNELIDVFPEFDNSGLVTEVIQKGAFIKVRNDEIVEHDDKEILVVLNGCLRTHHVRFGKKIIYNRGNLIGLYNDEAYYATDYEVVSSFVNLFKVDKQSFVELVRNFKTYQKVEERKDILRHLTNSKLFSRGFNSSMLVRLTRQAIFQHIDNEVDMSHQDLKDLYIIASGKAVALRDGRQVFGFGKGDFFGGSELLDGGMMDYSVRIGDDTSIIRIKNNEAKKYPLLAWQLFENCSLHNHLCNIGIFIDG